MNQDPTYNASDRLPEEDPQLAGLEHRLAALSPAGPRPQLRDAVLQAVEQERRQLADRRARRLWCSVMATTVVVIGAWCAPAAVLLFQLSSDPTIRSPNVAPFTAQADDPHPLPARLTPAAARHYAMALQNGESARE